MTEPPQELGIILEEREDEVPEDEDKWGEWEADEEEGEEGEGDEGEEEGEEEEEEEGVVTPDEESDEDMGYVSKYQAERQREAAAREKAKKEEFRRLIGLSQKKKSQGSIATIITLEDEIPEECLGSSTTSTYPCLKDIDISDSQLKLLNLFNLYPIPEDPGLVPAFWVLYPPAPLYMENGIQKFIDLMKVMGLRPMHCVTELLKTDRINLRYYGVDPKAVRAICAATYSNTSVQGIDLKDSWLTTDACFHLNDMLLDNTIMSHLNLSGCRIGPQGVKRLLDGIRASESLIELDLSNCALEDEGVNLLAPVIETHPKLETLNLADNHLGAECAKALQFMLASSNSIQRLDLSWNGLFTKDASKALFKGLLKNKSLVYVNLAWNAFGKECIQPLGLLLARTRNIMQLNLSGNRFTETGGQAIAKSLMRNLALEELYLGNNPLKSDGAIALVQAVTPDRAPNSRMQFLDLENVWVTKDILPELEKITNDRPWLRVRLGGIFSNYKLIGPDPRKIFLKRANFEAMKPKKKKQRRDFGHFILTLEDKLITKGKFRSMIKAFKLKLTSSLVKEIMNAFLGPKKKVDQGAMKAFYLEQYPDTTPPPPPPEKKPKKGKEKKEKEKKGKDKDKGKVAKEAPKEKPAEKAKSEEKGKDKKGKKKGVEPQSSTDDEGESEEEFSDEEGENW